MKISVVIPNWNGEHLLPACLNACFAQTIKPQIILVDNSSSDNSISFVRKTYPAVKIVELDKNYGFAGGVNAGIQTAMENGAEFVVLLNNDAVADPNWLEQLTESAKAEPTAGIVASKILHMDKKHLDSTGEGYSIWGMPFPRGRSEVDNKQYDDDNEIFAASGGASLYRAAMLKEIGLFDEDFFLYFEDVDISFRAQLAGWNVRYAPNAKVYHHIGATSAKLNKAVRYHSVKNFFLLYTKNMPGFLFWKYLPLFILQSMRLAAGSLLKGELFSYVKGLAGAFVLTPGVLLKRRNIQSGRKVSVRHINKLLYKHRPPKSEKLIEYESANSTTV